MTIEQHRYCWDEPLPCAAVPCMNAICAERYLELNNLKRLAVGAATVASEQADIELSQITATVEEIAEYFRQVDCTEYDDGIELAVMNLANLREKIAAWWTYKSEQPTNANPPLALTTAHEAAPSPDNPNPYNLPDYETLRGIVFSHIAGNQTTEELNEEMDIYVEDGDEPVITDDTDWGRGDADRLKEQAESRYPDCYVITDKEVN